MPSIDAARQAAKVIEEGYATAAEPTIKAIDTSVKAGKIQERLADLDAEVEELGDKPLLPNNPAYRDLAKDFDRTMQQNAARVHAVSSNLSEAAVEQADAVIRAGQQAYDPKLYARFNEQWSTPDAKALKAGVDFSDTAGWQREVNAYAAGSSKAVRAVALRGAAEGKHPRVVARELRELIQDFPTHGANNIMRTLFLESSRKAQALSHEHNVDIIDRVIRIEAMDDRTCMACIALHGTVHWERGDMEFAPPAAPELPSPVAESGEALRENLLALAAEQEAQLKPLVDERNTLTAERIRLNRRTDKARIDEIWDRQLVLQKEVDVLGTQFKRAQRELIFTDKEAKLDYKFMSEIEDEHKEYTKEHIAEFERMISGDWSSRPNHIDAEWRRAYLEEFGDYNDLRYPPRGREAQETFIHEMGHALEANDVTLKKDAVEFLLSRKGEGEEPRPLRWHDEREIAIHDEFTVPYAGRLYRGYEKGEVPFTDFPEGLVFAEDEYYYYATEISSVGMERMYSDPVEFAQDDPDHFDFTFEKVMRRK